MGAAGIHPTAVISAAAALGAHVTIGPFTVVEDDVEIGDGCVIGPHVMIGSGTRLGKGCRIFKGAAVGLVPQDLKFGGESTTLQIGDHTTVREFCTLNRGTAASGRTVIGSNCLLMAYCHVAHDCVIGNHVVIANNLAMAGHVEVGDYVRIGGAVTIHQFVRIGTFAFIAAQARPFMDVVPYAMVGVEPTVITGTNRIGLERAGYNEERRFAIKRAYRILFRSNLSLESALERLQHDFPRNDDIALLIAFVRGSSRGLMRTG